MNGTPSGQRRKRRLGGWIAKIGGVDLLVAAGTLWCLFSLVLFLPLIGTPPPFRWVAAMLLTLQFLALLAYGYGAAAPYVLATHDLPALALVLIGTAVIYGLRVHRRHASPGPEARR